MTAVTRQGACLMSSFFYGMDLQHTGIIHNHLPGDTHPLLFLHMLPINQPTITVWTFAIKKVGRPQFTKHVPFHTNRLYQFITPHSTLNATQLTNTNKTCHNNITLPTNIQYLKIPARPWTWPQTSQRHTNTMQYTRPDKQHTNALCKVQTTSQTGCSGHGFFLNITACWRWVSWRRNSTPQAADMI
jgi:hypothetical protein